MGFDGIVWQWTSICNTIQFSMWQSLKNKHSKNTILLYPCLLPFPHLVFNSLNEMDSKCSFSTESLKLLSYSWCNDIPGYILLCVIFCVVTFVRDDLQQFVSRQRSKEQKQLWAHIWWRSAKTPYRFTQTCVIAVQSQYVTHHSFYKRINTVLVWTANLPPFW